MFGFQATLQLRREETDTGSQKQAGGVFIDYLCFSVRIEQLVCLELDVQVKGNITGADEN